MNIFTHYYLAILYFARTNKAGIFDITDLLQSIADYLNKEGNKFSGFLFGFLFGLILAISFMRYALYVSSKHYKQSAAEQKEAIRELKFLVHDKLANIKVEPANKVWMNRLKNYFYKEDKKKKNETKSE